MYEYLSKKKLINTFYINSTIKIMDKIYAI